MKKFKKEEMESFIKNAAKKTNSTKKHFVSWCKLVAFHQAGLKDRWKREYEKEEIIIDKERIIIFS